MKYKTYIVMLFIVNLFSCNGSNEEEKKSNSFIQYKTYNKKELENVDKIKILVQSKPNAYTPDFTYFIEQSYIKSNMGHKNISIPIIGLYQNYDNHVEVSFLKKSGEAIKSDKLHIQTAKYVNDDPNSKSGESWINPDQLTIKKYNFDQEKPSFNYFMLKSKSERSPVIMDIDGEMRWLYSDFKDAKPTYFNENSSKIFSFSNNHIIETRLDGSRNLIALNISSLKNTTLEPSSHHNVRKGSEEGRLLFLVNGVDKENIYKESIIIEVDYKQKKVTKYWNLTNIFYDYLIDQHEDINKVKKFVRKDRNFVESILEEKNLETTNLPHNWFNWCHANDVFYNKNTLTISCREQFVVNIDYAQGTDNTPINWILGSPKKAWSEFKALKDLALEVEVDSGLTFKNKILTPEMYHEKDLYPIGQHSISIANDGSLLLHNNGLATHPVWNAPFIKLDETRYKTFLQKYKIDDGTATLAWQYNPENYSQASSSIYQHRGGSYLVNLAAADGNRKTLIQIINENKDKIFEISIPKDKKDGSGDIAWNAVPLDLSNVILK